MRLGRRFRTGKPEKDIFTFLRTLLIVFHLEVRLCKLESPYVAVVFFLQLGKTLYQIFRTLTEHRVDAVAVYKALRIVRFQLTELTNICFRLFRRVGLEAKLNQTDQHLMG